MSEQEKEKLCRRRYATCDAQQADGSLASWPEQDLGPTGS